MILNKKIEKAAYKLHRGKNWVVKEAIRVYLEQFENLDLIQEASKQSLLASKQEKTDANLWEANSDQEEWHA